MRPDDERAFRDLYAARARALRRTAFLLCGDWQQAEDLVQNAFAKCYVAWFRIRDPAAAEAYVRKVLTRGFLDDGRGHWSRQRPTHLISTLDRPEANESRDDRLILLQALRSIPPRQRACLVLRFWEDYSVAETARTLGCRPGTVKSQTARGLEALRKVLEEAGEERRPPPQLAHAWHAVGEEPT